MRELKQKLKQSQTNENELRLVENHQTSRKQNKQSNKEDLGDCDCAR